jgi:hypothetical protein
MVPKWWLMWQSCRGLSYAGSVALRMASVDQIRTWPSAPRQQVFLASGTGLDVKSAYLRQRSLVSSHRARCGSCKPQNPSAPLREATEVSVGCDGGGGHDRIERRALGPDLPLCRSHEGLRIYMLGARLQWMRDVHVDTILLDRTQNQAAQSSELEHPCCDKSKTRDTSAARLRSHASPALINASALLIVKACLCFDRQ